MDMSSPEYVVPPSIAADPEALAGMERFMSSVAAQYKQLRERGIPKEDARFVLPNATATRIVVTMNFRSWRHFIKVRALDPHSQWEIRELANRILDELYKVAPSVFQDLIDERERQKQA